MLPEGKESSGERKKLLPYNTQQHSDTRERLSQIRLSIRVITTPPYHDYLLKKNEVELYQLLNQAEELAWQAYGLLDQDLRDRYEGDQELITQNGMDLEKIEAERRGKI